MNIGPGYYGDASDDQENNANELQAFADNVDQMAYDEYCMIVYLNVATIDMASSFIGMNLDLGQGTFIASFVSMFDVPDDYQKAANFAWCVRNDISRANWHMNNIYY